MNDSLENFRGKMTKVPFYKQYWFSVILTFLIVGLIVGACVNTVCATILLSILGLVILFGLSLVFWAAIDTSTDDRIS